MMLSTQAGCSLPSLVGAVPALGARMLACEVGWLLSGAALLCTTQLAERGAGRENTATPCYQVAPGKLPSGPPVMFVTSVQI